MDLRYLDAPNIHKNTPVGMDFVKALSKCGDLELFNNGVIQILLDNHWKYWSFWSRVLVGLPLVIHLLVFWYWSNIVVVNIASNPDTFKP